MLTDPEKMMAAMAELTDSLSDDDKIEEARLQLLANPECWVIWEFWNEGYS